MRVFVTGASGHVASAVVPELISAGHEVAGLARSDSSAATVAGYGATVVRGDLNDLDGLREAAATADGVIHLAFNHEAMQSGDYDGAAAMDLAAIHALADGLDRGNAFVGTSGTLMLLGAGLDRAGTEDDVSPGGPRVDAENFVAGLAERGIRSSVVRLPPVVHSELDHHGFITSVIATAREKGVSAYVGEGTNRWPAGHTLDAGRLYQLALDKAPAGSRLHAVGDEGIPFLRIAETVGQRLDVPVKSITAEEAPAHFGFLGGLVQLDNPVSNARTREILGWEPSHPGLLEDLALEHYFKI
ncbi:SDR family oxidoreductase [Amycolatopsis sp.]|uniref:SDR family oxidoreductase n=1 Tax=Amycolatopsis sp. TaxID=37632 RepID=UPI002CA200B4|nr:SDR family oxidoreductase [Amycolatopsis sp.]HVV11343.1 SDR family oxidoreductase [Amycolatopsis sp.]